MLHCYVLMSNHYHLVIETPGGNLSRAMHHINGSYTTYINIKRKRCGHLFQGRYKAIVVDQDSYLLELSRYVHLNPVRVGLVEKPEDYPYSSYTAYSTGKKGDAIIGDLILGMICKEMGEARRYYREFVESGIGVELENPLTKTYGGIILGSDTFIKDTLKRLKGEDLQREETAHRRELKSRFKAEEILEAVAAHLGVRREDIVNSRAPEGRKIVVYLLKKYTGATNRQIGGLVGGLSYSAVAKVQERFTRQMVVERGMRKLVEKIEGGLSNVKG